MIHSSESARNHERWLRFKANHPKYGIAHYRLVTYGITEAQFQAMLKRQKHACALCKKPETVTRGGVTKAMAVDHCHRTGVVRGLLCHKCNLAIGMMSDDPALLEKAARYLRRHDKKNAGMPTKQYETTAATLRARRA